MQSDERSSRIRWALILGATVLVGGSALWLSRASWTGSSQSPSAPASGPGSKATRVGQDPPKAIPGPSDGVKSPRARLTDLIKRHASDTFIVERGIGIPFQPSDSRQKAYREFWDFISELKMTLGNEATPTLKAMMEEAESSTWKNLYLSVIVGLKDPENLPMLVSWSKAPDLETSQRMIAIYGLGELGTSSAWQAFQEVWPDIKKGKWENNLLESLRIGAFAAMGAFGKQGAEMLLREVDSLTKEGHGDVSWFFLNLVHGAEPAQLEKIAREGATQNLRHAAINALAEDLHSPASLRAFMGLMLQDSDPDIQKKAAGKLTAMLRMGWFSLQDSPEALQRIVSNYESLPAELQLALHLDPATRDLLPEKLEQFASKPAASNTDWWMRYLLGAGFASDPSMHGTLARHLLQHWKEGALAGAREAFQERVKEFSDPELSTTIVRMATDSEFSEVRGLAWDILSKGPADARQEALRKASTTYWSESENDRVRMIGQIVGSGSDARSTLLEFAKQESSTLPRIEIASALIGSGHGANDLSPEIRSQIAQDLGPILKGENDAGIRYITTHPKGLSEGLERFATLVRDYYANCGTLQQVSEIKSFPDRIFIPQKMIDADPDNVAYIKERLRNAALQAVDELRIRDSR